MAYMFETVVCPFCGNGHAHITYEENRVYQLNCPDCHNAIFHPSGSWDAAVGFFKRMGISDDARIRELLAASDEGRLVVLPCKEGDTVYRICPKCNDKHDGSCKNCAWNSCFSNRGCTTYGLWGDGQYPPDKCTIVPYTVFWNYIPNMMEKLGKTVFLTREEAEAALIEKEVANGKV